MVDADGVDAVPPLVAFFFRLLVPLLLILSDPGLLGGDSLTIAVPRTFTAPGPIPKCPPPDVGPWIIDGTTGATVAAGGGV